MKPETIDWRANLKRRIAVAAGALVLWSGVIEARLVYLQVVEHDELSSRADRQQSRTIDAPAKRGDILDRNGNVLAFSVDADSIYAVPAQIDDAHATAVALCGALDDCTPEDETVLTTRFKGDRAFAYVRRQASPEQARRVAALDLDGVGFVKENRRFYPNKLLAAHLLGYVGVDGIGLGGVEAAYDSLIKGRGGRVLIQTDARGRPFSHVERPSTAGGTLELTIDQYLQHVAERELRLGVEAHAAAGGTAIIMDPNSGEILALANWPTFNPNIYGEFEGAQRRNRAVQDIYEPGSTFKIVTASAAIEERVVTPDRLFDLTGGQIRFPGRPPIRDTRDYGVLSFEDIIVKSSNVGAILVGLEIGAERLGEYVDRFGFGHRASPDFPGESSGIVWDLARLDDSALASVSMGYQVGVTPLQMVAAVSAVANGGELLEPRIVRSVVRDGQRIPAGRTVRGRAITPETSATLTAIMEQVVERGTATRAQVPGYTIAGKTGTAKKLIDGSYQGHTDYNASFVGFAPSRAPAFAILVTIDAPHGPDNFYTGGSVAAPVFQRIAAAALRYLALPPSVDPSPPLLVTRRDEARARSVAGPATRPEIVAFTSASAGGSFLFPDLRGLGARDALRVLSRLGVRATLRGDGVVVEQEPAAGTTIVPGGWSTVWLRRQTPPAVNDAGP